MIKPEIPVGGRLKHFYQKWEHITEDQWDLDIIKQGYKLELKKTVFNGVKQTKINKQNSLFILQEVDELLQKKAIEIVPQNQIQSGFYSTLFLAEKKTRDLRPVINLRPLNRY